MSRPLALACLMLSVLGVGGCHSADIGLMPLGVHKAWKYQVEDGMISRVERVEVTRPVAVSDVEGYELEGPLGVSRLAWRGATLIAQSTAGARFEPPLPLLALDKPKASWSGTIETIGKSTPATAIITHSNQTLTVDAEPFSTVESQIAIKAGDKNMQLDTWFEPGVGIVKQEQTTNGQMDVRLTFVSGP